MTNRLRLALYVSPSVLVRRGLDAITGYWRANTGRAADMRGPTHAADVPGGRPAPLLDRLDVAAFRARSSFTVPLAELHRTGMFDLLGSGWISVRHGMTCAGCEGRVYPPAAPVIPDREGRWLEGRINSANLTASQAIWRMTGVDYAPIDWHIDYKSGFRWPEDTWHGDIVYGHAHGADIKLPWELARMQHLTLYAAAYAATKDDSYAHVARDQILDFITQNPPRFGVNWRCTMDVSIRAANWIMAWSLFRASGFTFDGPFEDILKRSLLDHGRHVVSRLEWYPEGRGNHYLADIAGLAFIAAALPSTVETDAWLAFAAQEISAEVSHQFHDDGGNFEASVAYHRLSLEMAVFALALLTGLPDERRRRLNDVNPEALRTYPHRPLRPSPIPPGTEVSPRIGRAADFLRDLTKPNGLITQVGDNDSGRFFKLHPVYEKTTAREARARYANLGKWRGLPDDAVYWDENALDGRATVAAAAALLDRSDLKSWAGENWIDALVIAALRGDTQDRLATTNAASAVRIRTDDHPEPHAQAATVDIAVPGGRLREGLTAFAYPDFGVYVFCSKRIFLSVRCGPIGQNGRGGHAHNDQLAIELTVDGEDWIADPGSYLYTADRTWRNAYRSVAAHAAPRLGEREPGRLDLGDFWLGDEAKTRCLLFEDARFIGEHRGFGSVVRRDITVFDDRLVIRDSGAGIASGQTALNGRDATRRHFRPAVPFSPGYGKKLTRPS